MIASIHAARRRRRKPNKNDELEEIRRETTQDLSKDAHRRLKEIAPEDDDRIVQIYTQEVADEHGHKGLAVGAEIFGGADDQRSHVAALTRDHLAFIGPGDENDGVYLYTKEKTDSTTVMLVMFAGTESQRADVAAILVNALEMMFLTRRQLN